MMDTINRPLEILVGKRLTDSIMIEADREEGLIIGYRGGKLKKEQNRGYSLKLSKSKTKHYDKTGVCYMDHFS